MRKPISTPKLSGLNQGGIARHSRLKSVRKCARDLLRPQPGDEAFDKYKKPLDALNDKAEDRILHATKGFRPISHRRMISSMVTHGIKNGQYPSSMTFIRRELGIKDAS